MSLLPEQEQPGWGEWFGSFLPEVQWGGDPYTPHMPPDTMTPPNDRRPAWEQNGRGQPNNAAPLPPPEMMGMDGSGTSTPWGGPDMTQVADPYEVVNEVQYPEAKSPYSFLDAPGASDALVAFGAAMLKAPDFNSGLGDAALAVNRVAQNYRMPTEADYARAKQLGMLERIKSGKGMAQGGLEIDRSVLYRQEGTNHAYFDATQDGVRGFVNADTGEFTAGAVPGLSRDVYDFVSNRNRRAAGNDADFEADFAKNIPAHSSNVYQFNELAKLAADPKTAVDSSLLSRVGGELERLAPGYGLTEFDAGNITEYDMRIQQAALAFAKQSFQGQGQVTEYERKMIFDSLGKRGTLTKDRAVKLLTALRDMEQRKIDMFRQWQTMDEQTKSERFKYNFGTFVAMYMDETNKRQMGLSSNSGGSGENTGGRKPLADYFN
jgi:hypothetical protein